jgi:hypothetical protein
MEHNIKLYLNKLSLGGSFGSVLGPVEPRNEPQYSLNGKNFLTRR